MGKLSFYRDQPLFGLDIGHSSLKVMQLDTDAGGHSKVIGYGMGPFESRAVSGGVVVDYEALAGALHELFAEKLQGVITSKRVACTVPTARTFSRPMKLPPMNDKDITEAVHLEAEQYIPIPLNNLYVDFDVARRDEQGIELLMVASPRNIVDSHIKFLEGVGLEPVALEPTMNAAARFFGLAGQEHGQPSVLMDLGSSAVDLAVFDKTMFVNSTVSGGGDSMTALIAQKLDIDNHHADHIKIREGISHGEHREQIKEALEPLLDNLVREARKIIRYYDDRIGGGKRKVTQIITLGGGATMPGLNEYLNAELNLPTHTLDTWGQIDFGDLTPPPTADRPIFATVAGEALLNPRSVLK